MIKMQCIANKDEITLENRKKQFDTNVFECLPICRTVDEVNIEKYKVIGSSAFEGCDKLKKVKIGTSVTEILSDAFKDCTSLVIIILKNVQHIGKNAFKNCTNLKFVIFKIDNARISENAFWGCDNVTLYANDTDSEISLYAKKNKWL